MNLFLLFTFLTSFYKVQSQLCVTPGISTVPQVIANPPVTQVIGTTVVDNSVSIALANALQLLIVSDIIDSKLGASCLSNLLTVNPIIETVSPCYPTEYVSPIVPCAAQAPIVPNYGLIEPIYPRPYGVIEPYPYLGCSEVITPVCETFGPISPNFGYGPYSTINSCGTEIVTPCYPNTYPEIITPTNYFSLTDIISPNYYPNNCGVEIITPSSFSPICNTEVINYNPGYFGYNEIISPYSPCGLPEVISPCGPIFNGIPEIVTQISPCKCGCYANVPEFSPCNNYMPEIISPFNTGCGSEIFTSFSPYYSGISEIISSCNPGCIGIPEYLPANPYRPCNGPEIITSCVNNIPEVFIPNSCNTGCSGCDFRGPVGTPFAPITAEVIIPPSMPPQFSYNFGYFPSSGPCANYEPITFGPNYCF